MTAEEYIVVLKDKFPTAEVELWWQERRHRWVLSAKVHHKMEWHEFLYIVGEDLSISDDVEMNKFEGTIEAWLLNPVG